jgi:hypothetical protein
MDRVAETLLDQGSLVEASALYALALSERARSLGEAHADTLATAEVYAATLAALGDLARASDIQRETLRLRREQLGPRDPATLRSERQLAATLEALGRLGRRLIPARRSEDRSSGPDRHGRTPLGPRGARWSQSRGYPRASVAMCVPPPSCGLFGFAGTLPRVTAEPRIPENRGVAGSIPALAIF